MAIRKKSILRFLQSAYLPYSLQCISPTANSFRISFVKDQLSLKIQMI